MHTPFGYIDRLPDAREGFGVLVKTENGITEVHVVRPADPRAVELENADRELEVIASFSMRTDSFVGFFGPAVANEQQRTPRNAPCPCGSGKKFKHCHGGGTE